MDPLKMHFLLKTRILDCCVSLPEGRTNLQKGKPSIQTNWDSMGCSQEARRAAALLEWFVRFAKWFVREIFWPWHICRRDIMGVYNPPTNQPRNYIPVLPKYTFSGGVYTLWDATHLQEIGMINHQFVPKMTRWSRNNWWAFAIKGGGFPRLIREVPLDSHEDSHVFFSRRYQKYNNGIIVGVNPPKLNSEFAMPLKNGGWQEGRQVSLRLSYWGFW